MQRGTQGHVGEPRGLTKRFGAVVKTHKRRSNKIYKSELTKIKIENHWVDPQRTRLTLITELTWSNLG